MDYNETKKNIYDSIGVGVLIPIANDDMFACISFIKKETLCNGETAKLIWYDLEMGYDTKENSPIIVARENYKAEQARKAYQYRNSVEYLYCYPKDTKKIFSISKAGSVTLWGVFAINKTGKQWHCNNCNSNFQPVKRQLSYNLHLGAYTIRL